MIIMLIEELQQCGLNLNEAKIYCLLLQEGELQAGKISKNIQLNRRTVYDTIERLIDKGLIKFSMSANTRIFQAVDPEKILNKIKKQEKVALDILPKLKALKRNKLPESESWNFKGKKGIKSILDEILKCKEYCAFGSSGKFMEIMEHDYVMFQKRKEKLKIAAKIIVSNSSKNKKFIKAAYAEFKFLNEEDIGPTTTLIYGNSIAIIIWDLIPMGIVIKSKHVNKSYKKYFNYLWGKAER